MSLLNKKRLTEKLRVFYNNVKENDGKMGTNVRGIDVNVNNRCNFKCRHCFTKSPDKDHVKESLSVKTIARLADEADELGIFEFDLQGGELLLDRVKLYDIINAIRPERFYLYLTTNGYFLDGKVARTLAGLGVSRVSVSIDSPYPVIHDRFRGKRGAWKKAIDALIYVQEAGIDSYLNITVDHWNVKSKELEIMLKYSETMGYTSLINIAVPSGRYQYHDEVMIDEKDRVHLMKLRKRYKNIIRDIWNPFDRSHEKLLGCNCVNRSYVTPLGDVLVCPYVHVKIGNIFESSLKDIIDYGFSFDIFREFSELCLGGENREFVKNNLCREGMSIFNPIKPEDLIC